MMRKFPDQITKLISEQHRSAPFHEYACKTTALVLVHSVARMHDRSDPNAS